MMKITLELYDKTYSVEGVSDDLMGVYIVELFTRLMVVAGFSPSIIRLPEDEGRYEYVGENEEVVERRND